VFWHVNTVSTARQEETGRSGEQIGGVVAATVAQRKCQVWYETCEEGTMDFSELWWRYRKRLLSRARQLLPHLAEDLVQETYCKALAHWPPRTTHNLYAWLLRIARNTAVDWTRREALPQRYAVTPKPSRWARASTPVYTEAQLRNPRVWLSDEVWAAYERLNPAQQQTLILQAILEYSLSEIQTETHICAATLATQAHRAKRYMQEALQKKVM
jgi:RNA polymerase sigma-70 factor (ECF subfamily)